MPRATQAGDSEIVKPGRLRHASRQLSSVTPKLVPLHVPVAAEDVVHEHVEPAPLALGHIASAIRSAAARSSASGTFGRTSSQSGSAIPDASSMPSGLGRNQTWKCAPPSPQR